MVFISFGFYVFIAIMLFVYYLIPLKFRWCALLLGSMSFYWYLSQNSRYGFFAIIVLSFVSWMFSLLMEKDHNPACGIPSYR